MPDLEKIVSVYSEPISISYHSSKSKLIPNNSAIRTSLKSIVLNYSVPKFIIILLLLYSFPPLPLPSMSLAKLQEVFVMTLIKDRDLFFARGGPRVYLFSCSLPSQCRQSHVWVHTHTHAQSSTGTHVCSTQAHCSVALHLRGAVLSPFSSILFSFLSFSMIIRQFLFCTLFSSLIFAKQNRTRLA